MKQNKWHNTLILWYPVLCWNMDSVHGVIYFWIENTFVPLWASLAHARVHLPKSESQTKTNFVSIGNIWRILNRQIKLKQNQSEESQCFNRDRVKATGANLLEEVYRVLTKPSKWHHMAYLNLIPQMMSNNLVNLKRVIVTPWQWYVNSVRLTNERATAVQVTRRNQFSRKQMKFIVTGKQNNRHFNMRKPSILLNQYISLQLKKRTLVFFLQHKIPGVHTTIHCV